LFDHAQKPLFQQISCILRAYLIWSIFVEREFGFSYRRIARYKWAILTRISLEHIFHNLCRIQLSLASESKKQATQAFDVSKKCPFLRKLL
jgi:hypothetical protein